MSDGSDRSPSPDSFRRSASKRPRTDSDHGPDHLRCDDASGSVKSVKDGHAGASCVETPSDDRVYVDQKFDLLHRMLVGLKSQLSAQPLPSVGPPASSGDFSGFHDLSQSDEDIRGDVCGDDPLDRLDDITSAQPCGDGDSADADFQKAIDELSGFFHGEEDKSDPLAEKLASVLDLSLRRRPNDDGVKATAAKIKLPANVPNLKAKNLFFKNAITKNSQT